MLDVLRRTVSKYKMGLSCAFFGCTNKQGGGKSFHRFPKDPVIRELLIKTIHAFVTQYTSLKLIAKLYT